MAKVSQKTAEESPFKSMGFKNAIYDPPYESRSFEKHTVDAVLARDKLPFFGKVEAHRDRLTNLRAFNKKLGDEISALEEDKSPNALTQVEIKRLRGMKKDVEFRLTVLSSSNLDSTKVRKKLELIAARYVLDTLGIERGHFKEKKVIWMLENGVPVTPGSIGRSKKQLLAQGRENKEMKDAIVTLMPEKASKVLKDKKRVAAIWHPNGEAAYFAGEGRQVTEYQAREGKRLSKDDASGRHDVTPVFRLNVMVVASTDGIMLRYFDGIYEFVPFGKTVPRLVFEQRMREAESNLREDAMQLYDQIEGGRGTRVEARHPKEIVL